MRRKSYLTARLISSTRIRAGLLLILPVLLPPIARAQSTPSALAPHVAEYAVHPDYSLRQYTVLNGLPSNTINAVTHTSDGYLWLGTNEGLVRFDGAQFTLFNATNTPELASNRIARLQEAPEGLLWISTDQGDLSLYREGRFTRFEAQAGIGISSHQWVYTENDTVWIETQRGLGRYVDGRLELHRPDLIDGEVLGLIRDRRGRLWVSVSARGIYRLDPTGTVQFFDLGAGGNLLLDQQDRVWGEALGRVFRIEGDRVETIHRSGTVYQINEGSEGSIWITSPAEGWWRHASSGERTLVPMPAVMASADFILEGPEGGRWRLGTTIEQGFGEDILYRDEEPIFRVRDAVYRFIFDERGHLWINTLRNGLFRLRRSFLQTLGEAEGLHHRAVYPILEDRAGRVWVGTFGEGLARFDEARRATVILPEASGVPTHALSFYEDRAGRIWVGGIDRTCYMEGDQCRSDDLPNLVHLSARAISEDRQGRFWIGGEDGLVVGQGTGSERTWTRVASPEGLPRAWVRSITETRDGTLLFGTNGDGLLRLVERAPYSFDVLSTRDGLPSDLVRDVYEDRDGFLWIALEDQGLCRLDRQGHPHLRDGDLRCLDSRQGLYQSGLHRILEDDHGRFWFNTNNGIFWVERTQLMAFLDGAVPSVTSVSYTEAEGMRNREGNGGVQPAGVKASDGRLWLPTQDGVVVIEPGEVPLPEAPPVLVEAVQVGEELRRAAPWLQLSESERDVTLQYTALEFARAEDVRFQYWLEGYEATWRDGGTQRQATYTNLPPGSYVFHVRAGIGGVWGEPARVTIERLPYFWETLWFYGLVAVFFAVVGPSVYAYRVRRLKAREAELEQVVEERTAQLAEKASELERANELKSRFLANISHEFRTPLTLTFGPLDDALTGRFYVDPAARPHFERARRNGSRLLRLINQLLDLSKLDAGALLLRSEQRDLAELLRQIAAMFESMAAARGLHLTAKIPKEAFPHVYDPDKLEKVVINLLSNAFKFTPEGGKVSLTLSREEDRAARIVVADTGSGIAEEHLPHLFDRFYQVEGSSTRKHEGSGIGLALVREFVELHQGTITVESTVGFGTSFTVTLPVADAELERAASEAGLEPEDRAEPLPVVLDTHAHDLDAVSGQVSPPTPGDPPFLSSSPEPAPDADPENRVAIDETLVLLVEDNADMRAYIRAHLEDHVTLVEADNGCTGVERALELVPDLVLSDVMMPEKDGLELCQALKTDTRTSHIPVVLLTAKADVEHRIAGFESGADAYLPKPFNAEELQVRVRTLIEERRRLRARFAREQGAAGQVVGAAEEVTVLPPREAAFLSQVEEVVAERLSEHPFGVDQLAEAVSMSPRQLLRKLRALTDETPVRLLRRLRMERAAVLLDEGAASVKEVSYQVGYQSTPSFTRAFREVHGLTPSGYVAQRLGQ